MTYMYPNYVPINMTSGNMLEPGVASKGKYGLFLYAEGWRNVDFRESLRRLSGVPVLFIPGNAGSYKQVRSMASESTRQFESGFTPAAAPVPTTIPRAMLEGAHKCSKERCQYASRLDWFAVDFLEEYSALDSRILQDQTEFVVKAIEKILDLYKQAARFRRIKRGRKRTRQLPTNVILFGHSMGGVAARAALFHPAFREGSVKTIVTVATPHRSPPVPLQLSGSLFYSNFNRKWRQGFADTGPLRDVIVVSISGGSRDTQVRTPLMRLDGIVPPRNGFSVSASAVPDVWLETDHQVIVWCNQLVVKLSKALLLLSDPATRQPHDSRVVRREILAANLRSALPEALGWLPRGSWTGDLDSEDLAEIQSLLPPGKGLQKAGEGVNDGQGDATTKEASDGAEGFEPELEREVTSEESSKSGIASGPGYRSLPEKEPTSQTLRAKADGRDSERETSREETVSAKRAERGRNDQKAERKRTDEADSERTHAKRYGRACPSASELDGTAEREVVSGSFLALENADARQRWFDVRAGRQGLTKPPVLVTSRGFVVLFNLEPCTEVRMWMVRGSTSAEPVSRKEGNSSGRTEPEQQAADAEREEAKQQGRGKGLDSKGAGVERPSAESEQRGAEQRGAEPERRGPEADRRNAAEGVTSIPGAAKRSNESLEEERASGVDGTERVRNEALDRAEQKRNAGRAVSEVTLQAGRLPAGSLLSQSGSDRPTWILRLLPEELADVDWVVIETSRADESPPAAEPVLFAQLIQPGEGTLQLGWRDLLATSIFPRVLTLPEGHSLWTEVTAPLPLSLLPMTLRFTQRDCPAVQKGDPKLDTGTCSAPCSPPLVLAWDPSIEQERIWTVTNATTLQTDGSPGGGASKGGTNPPSVILSDPRCGYRVSVTIAPHLACFRFLATNAPRIVSFAVALVLFILAVQSHPRKPGKQTPNPVAALCQLLTLQTTPLTLRSLLLGLQTPLRTRLPVSLVVVALAAALIPISRSLEAARAIRVTSADVYLLTSSALAMTFAVGLVALLAAAQATLLRLVFWSLQRFRSTQKTSCTAPEWKHDWRLTGTTRVFVGCFSVAACLLIHPAIALLVILVVRTLDTVTESCRSRDHDERRTLVKEPSADTSTDGRSVVANGEQTGKAGVATAVPRGSTGYGHVSTKDQCGAALQRQSGCLLLAFLNFVVTAPSGFASLPCVLRRWRAPSALNSLLVIAPIVEALLSPHDRLQGGRNRIGCSINQTVRSCLYVLLGAYACYEGLVESPLGAAPVFTFAALVGLFFS
ncbi:hypothetical protein KFL_003470080 [Klebsormidium nitens]|uniref:GPI inositol-deacylase n=1 Tax=Klebsormidium nitens TaxID=105231 RepID=A0A1Y1IE17_KLENI|nr:hypothetical protein KFL_003470080 [Klebsormidium nitens]|eukprot:GAQ87351.1 hypothetical protein KFL_003470080 [Klebsormidium nitens]